MRCISTNARIIVQEQYYYWEMTELNRKLLLCSFIMFIQPG